MYHAFTKRFASISFASILVICTLLPILFLPSSWGGVTAVKGVLLYVGTCSALAFWLLDQYVSGAFTVPRLKALLVLGAWVVLAFISALTSANKAVSFWGRGFAADSFATVLVLGIFVFLVAMFARDHKRVNKLFLATFIGAAATVILQILLSVMHAVPFVAAHFSHVAREGTLVGSWVDFAYFTTMTLVMTLLMREVWAPKGFFKIFSLVTMVACTIALIFLNFKAAWIVTIVSALLVFVYKSSIEHTTRHLSVGQSAEANTHNKRFPLISFSVLIVALFFLLSAGSIGARIAQTAGISFSEVRPSMSASTHVMRAVLSKDPIFGIGAGRFGTAWNLHHELGFNTTQFWNTTFDTGHSMVQTFVTTHGVLVTLALIVLIGMAIVIGFRLFNYSFPDRFSKFIALSVLVVCSMTVGLWLYASPGIVLVMYGFWSMGMLFGMTTLVGRTATVSWSYLGNPRKSFLVMFLIIVVTMTAFVGAYFSINRYSSIAHYNLAVSAADMPTAARLLDRSIAISRNDIYFRTKAYVAMQQFITAANTDTPDKAVLQSLFSEAEQSAKAAVAWDQSEPLNWLTLSQVYQLIIGVQGPDAYTAAKQAADQAQQQAPTNPLYVLNQAKLALANKDSAAATDFIVRALELKPDYLDAYILRAQIRVAGGDSAAPTQELIAYTQHAPYDAQGFLMLAQTYSATKQYVLALDAYNRARALAPRDPNALIGVVDTLSAMGDRERALATLDTFAQLFPNIGGVAEKRAQIQSGAITTQ